jgi:16S rRNA (guanine527-N7)-methyltransferase
MNRDVFIKALDGILHEMGLPADGALLDKLFAFHQRVYTKNPALGLTAIEEADAPLLNFADALSALPHLGGAGRVCDIGSGAGFPGLVLAIALPDVRFTLMDSLKRRVDFLRGAIGALGLDNAEAVHLRAEEAGRDPRYRGAFDAAVARALAPMSVLYEYALPLLRVGGRLIAFKGEGAQVEANAASAALTLLGGGGARVLPAGVPGRMHRFVVATKERETPDAYPRRPGKPAKSPL